MMHSAVIDIENMSTSEKILLVEELWDDIATCHPDEVPISPAQQQDLKQRLAYLQRHSDARIPWETARRCLEMR